MAQSSSGACLHVLEVGTSRSVQRVKRLEQDVWLGQAAALLLLAPVQWY